MTQNPPDNGGSLFPNGDNISTPKIKILPDDGHQRASRLHSPVWFEILQLGILGTMTKTFCYKLLKMSWV